MKYLLIAIIVMAAVFGVCSFFIGSTTVSGWSDAQRIISGVVILAAGVVAFLGSLADDVGM